MAIDMSLEPCALSACAQMMRVYALRSTSSMLIGSGDQFSPALWCACMYIRVMSMTCTMMTYYNNIHGIMVSCYATMIECISHSHSRDSLM